MLPPILPMRPLYVEKLWGGTRVRDLPAKKRPGHAPPVGVRVGESWEVADLPEGCTFIDGGPLHGMSLREAAVRFGRALVGERARPGPDGVLRFPLLVKLLDADDDLSVQVHPHEAWARSHPGARAKDEAWLVVDAAPGSTVLHGTKDGVDRDAFLAGIHDRRAHELLRDVVVFAGDLVRIEPGVLHAVGRGCLLLEVQEPSDTTFRVWDYDRRDNEGRPRSLHIDEALQVARFGPQPPPIVGRASAGTASIRTAHYTLELQSFGAGVVDLPRPPNEPMVVFVLHGAVTIEAGTSDVVSAGSGPQSAALPAGGTAVITAESPPLCLRTSAPAAIAVMSTGG